MLTKVFFLQFMLASILLWSPVASQQIDNSNPVTIPPYVIPPDDSNEAVCPRGDPEILSEIETTIRPILANWIRDSIPCGGPGWRQVVFINMTDPVTNCPPGFNETSDAPFRVCGKTSLHSYIPFNSSFGSTCHSTTFSTGGTPYSRVCGRIRAYNSGIGTGFRTYHDIDSRYVDGLTLTHGPRSSREHIWSFAIGYIWDIRLGNYTFGLSCPCVQGSNNQAPPPFVGNDYFCDSVQQSDNSHEFRPDNPLWDGQGCPAEPHPYACACERLNPPWFTKILPASTTDDIEMRHCCSSIPSNRTVIYCSTPFDLVELYVQ